MPEGRIGVLSAGGIIASNLKEIALSTIIVQVVTVKALPSLGGWPSEARSGGLYYLYKSKMCKKVYKKLPRSG